MMFSRLALAVTMALCVACAGKGVPTEEGYDGSGGAGGTMTGGRGGAMAGAGGGGGSGGSAGSGGLAGGGAGTAQGGGAGTSTGGAGGTGNTPVGDGSCNAPGILLCDDFESLGAGSEPAGPNWKPQPMWQQDRIKIDASQKHSGTRSISVVGASYAAQLIAAKVSPAPDNRFFVRAWMRLEKSTKDMGGHVSFIEGAEAEGDNGEELRLGASHGIVDVNLIPGSKGTGGGEKTQFSNGDVDIPRTGGGLELAANRWYCIEALFDGKAHEFRAWVDGTELAGMHVTDWKQGRTNWSPTYTFIKIGGQNFSGQMGRVFYDDVAIGTQRIGCGS